jgi:hypothetical protein
MVSLCSASASKMKSIAYQTVGLIVMAQGIVGTAMQAM